MVGCWPNSQYKLWIPARGTALIARDVTIDETSFPARQLMQNQRDAANRLILNGEDADDVQQPGRKEQLTSENIDQSAGQGATDVMHAEPQPTPALTDEQLEAVTHYPVDDAADHISQQSLESDEQEEKRQDGDDYQAPEGSTDRRYPNRERRPPSYYAPGSSFFATAFSVINYLDCDPKTIDEALQQHDAKEWKKAISSELKSHSKHGTWKVVSRKKGVKPLSTKFVFLRKYNNAGQVIRHKARLVVRGFFARRCISNLCTCCKIHYSTSLSNTCRSEGVYGSAAGCAYSLPSR